MPNINLDTDPDYILTTYQGKRIPTTTRLAVDDGEHNYGGVTQGGGTASAGTAGAALNAQQNISQIQENPLPGCLAHSTPFDVFRTKNSPSELLVIQCIEPGWFLRFGQEKRRVHDVVRSWCLEMWIVRTENVMCQSSITHRIVQNPQDIGGTSVGELKVGESTWLRETPDGFTEELITECKPIGIPGWVYQVMLEGDTPESHWFTGPWGETHENAKPNEER